MKTKHTPGPWAWIKDNESWFLLQNIGAQKIILKASDLKTCPAIPENWQEGPLGLRLVDFDINSPNAKLIAAAPLLLEACEDILLMIENKCLTPSKKLIAIDVPFKSLKQAIKKAKGEI